MKKHLSALALALAVLLPAEAQQDAGRGNKRIAELFASVVEKSAASVVRVRCKDKDVALGTVVGEDGLIVTKFSELTDDEVVVVLPDGKEHRARFVGSEERHDLALLRIDAKGLPAVQWADSKSAPVGRWVASAGPGRLPVAIGVVGVAARKLPAGGGPSPNSGFFGAGFDLDFAGIKVSEITPKGPAQKAGVKSGDVIVSVNGVPLADVDDFIAMVQRGKPGDVLSLRVGRAGKEEGLKVTLEKRPGGSSRGDKQNSMGSKLSERRTGFPVVLQHDGVVKPSECGGPLVDLEGRVVGINVARAGRTETYAIPGEAVRELLPLLRKGEDRTKGR